jgi:peptide/nickel transport system substrate-binding protein
MTGRILRWTLVMLFAGASSLAALTLVEPPALLDAVAQGKLPPIAQRMPRQPAVGIQGLTDLQPGRHGGSMRMLIAGAKDTRLMVVYSYARLVAFTPDYELVPDILESVENEGNRVFTLKLRAGHRWSDGHPFTAEDFRYYWEDVARNPMLSPTGVPNDLQVEGEMPRFEVIDETTVRYRWSKPNPYFLPGLAGSRPLDIFKPAHYLRQFHERYAKPEDLARRIKEARQRNWAALHNRVDNSYRNDNPDLPTLLPWQIVTKAPSERFVFKRNPYYHRVDQEGRQLPYLDEVVMFVADSKIIAAKTGAGEVDLQARYLRFDNYTFLKEGEKRNRYAVRLWRTGKGAQIALYPNMNCNDPVWRELLRDVRVRRALSLAINRHEINQIIYYGLATPSNNTVLPQSALFDKSFQQRWTAFDLRLANKLLDEVGLTKRDSEGFRLLPDGRRAQIVI